MFNARSGFRVSSTCPSCKGRIEHECGAGRAVQDDGLDLDVLAMALTAEAPGWFGYVIPATAEEGVPYYVNARWVARRVAENYAALRAASPLNASGDER